MTTVPFERVGRIATGPDAGQFVLVRDDQERTGGFLIFKSTAPDVFSEPEVFDAWVGQREDLDAFFAEAGWTVEWQPPLSADTPASRAVEKGSPVD